MKQTAHLLRVSTWMFALLVQPSTAFGEDIFAVQSRLSTPNFQLFLELNDDSSVNFNGPLFSPAGGVYGMTFLADTLFAVELENGTLDDYLVTIPHEGFFVGQGGRVGAIGFENVESLANANGQLFATSLSFPGHMTTLLTIDSTSGVGTAVGTGDRDVMIVGLAHDPVSNTLYGAGTPFALVDEPNLYSLDMETGATTLIGDMGQNIQSLTWDAELGLIGAFDRLYQIDSSTGVAVPLGETDFTDGIPNEFNGLYSLASLMPTTGLACDLNGDGSCTVDDLNLVYAQPGLTDSVIAEWLSSASSVDISARQFRPGDTDLNGTVDFPDFLALAANFGSSPNALWGQGNFDSDGAVAFPDFLALSSNFGQTSMSPQNVPEPSTSFLMLMAIVIGLARFSRRLF